MLQSDLGLYCLLKLLMLCFAVIGAKTRGYDESLAENNLDCVSNTLKFEKPHISDT